MNYFVNENIFTLNSGTEFSAVKRIKLFHAQGIPAKILTRNYNSQLAGDLKRVGLSHSDVVNMYDYFQNITDIDENDVNVRYASVIDKKLYHIEGIDANKSLIKHAGHIIGEVTIAPATVGIIASIDYYNEMGESVAKDIWDRRGFKSSTQYFHPDGNVGTQIFYDYRGNVRLEITHMNINGVLHPTMYKLLDYQKKVYRFNTEQELFIFFMNELAFQEASVFINDRISLISSVAEIKNSRGKWQFLHASHLEIGRQDGTQSKTSEYLENLFTTLESHFDGILVPTEQEAAEIKKNWKIKHILALPDTYAEKPVRSSKIQRQKHKIIYLGRLSDEKNPTDIIEIIKIVHQSIPDIKFEFYGYASSEILQQKLQHLVDKYGLKNNVIFKGYQTKEVLECILQETSLFLNTSESESFGMNILEAMTYGVPIVSYQVKYGLSKLIDNGISGYFVPYGSKRQAAKSIIKILINQKLWHLLSKGAADKAQIFSIDKVWERWAYNNRVVNNLFIN
ncbi:accessory Sec system glycosyltransferase Asp1 [Lactococcus allomyrinae]|uniref:Accessory Sec system glycosyltransferase Asp1 n=1 Tax=Lactococcus allomyrinae TaxID=2419773 RepID=A0A387BGS5_9LACT|nr:accessory Sec system glycosyltransferase Asp1 [Lactococcus allomyrinae]AYG00589.1 accessory Sec system glycosyltransferase Asp1 [Lactococcus allomyrinae]